MQEEQESQEEAPERVEDLDVPKDKAEDTKGGYLMNPMKDEQ